MCVMVVCRKSEPPKKKEKKRDQVNRLYVFIMTHFCLDSKFTARKSFPDGPFGFSFCNIEICAV